MILSNIISLSRIFIYIFSVVLLKSTIKTKNKRICKNNFILSIFFILYLYISIVILPEFAGIELDWNLLIIFPIVVVDCIILIINIVISRKKLKNNELKDENNNFIKSYLVILLIFPIAFVGISFFREIFILNNSDLIITFNYQNGIIVSEDSRYAIGEKFCEEISISERFVNKTIGNSGYCSYTIKHSSVGDGYSITSYDDPELNKIDTTVIKQLYNDIELNTVQEKRHEAMIDKINGTNYYIVSHTTRDKENEPAVLIAEYVYNGVSRIDNINALGYIETANVYFD